MQRVLRYPESIPLEPDYTSVGDDLTGLNAGRLEQTMSVCLVRWVDLQDAGAHASKKEC
jgi:hypothetical protein